MGNLLHSWDDLIGVAGMVVTVLPIPAQSATLPYFLGTLGALPLGILVSGLGSQISIQYFSHFLLTQLKTVS